MRAALLALALLLFAAPATAQEAPGGSGWFHGAPGPWATTARTAYGYMGPKERPTGGAMIQADTTRSWALAEGLVVAAGVELAIEGFDTGASQMAILGGVTAQLRGRTLWHPLWLGAGLHLDAGRLPTCSRWGLCLQYAGVFPAVSASASYAPSSRVRFELQWALRWINTLAYNGPGFEGGFGGTIVLPF